MLRSFALAARFIFAASASVTTNRMMLSRFSLAASFGLPGYLRVPMLINHENLMYLPSRIQGRGCLLRTFARLRLCSKTQDFDTLSALPTVAVSEGRLDLAENLDSTVRLPVLARPLTPGDLLSV